MPNTVDTILAKLVARACYTSKQLFDDVREREAPVSEDEVDTRFQLCEADIAKSMELCKPSAGTPRGDYILETIKKYASALLKFKQSTKAFIVNPFDFQLRQNLQSAHKEVARNFNLVLASLEAKSIPTKSINDELSLTDQVRKVAQNIKQLCDKATSGNIGAFVPIAKTVFIQMRSLQTTLTKQQNPSYTEAAASIAQLSVIFIKAAKEVCQKSDEATKKNFLDAKQKTTKQLQEILFLDKLILSPVGGPSSETKSRRPSSCIRPALQTMRSATPTKRNPNTNQKQNFPSPITEKKGSLSDNAEKRSSISELQEKLNTVAIGAHKPKLQREISVPISKMDVDRAKSLNDQFEPKLGSSGDRQKQTGKRKKKSEKEKEKILQVTEKRIRKKIKSEGSSRKKISQSCCLPVTRKNSSSRILSMVDELQKKPYLFILHDHKVTNEQKEITTIKEKRQAKNSIHGIPKIPEAKIRFPTSWKESLAETATEKTLNEVLNLLACHIPAITNNWEKLSIATRNDLVDQIGDTFLRSELTQRIAVVGKCEYTKNITNVVISLIASAYDCMKNLDEDFIVAREERLQGEYLQLLNLLKEYISLSKFTEVLPNENILDFLKKKENYDFASHNEYFVVAAASSSLDYFAQLKALLSQHSKQANLTSMELICFLRVLTTGCPNHQTVLFLYTIVYSTAETFEKLIYQYQTSKHIAAAKKEQRKEMRIFEKELDDLVDIDIWSGDDDDISTDTINSLVRKVTVEYDRAFMETVIYTLRSYTTPTILFRKLARRFLVPPRVDQKSATAIQLRVGIVLKFWLKNQFNDFDETLVAEVREFLELLPSFGQEILAEGVRHNLEEKIIERNQAGNQLYLRPGKLLVPEISVIPFAYIMNFSLEDIAKQMTLIDYNLLKGIQPSELMGQAWTTPKYQHQSMNINWCLDRLNLVSYWVPTIVLSCNTVKGRKVMFEWFYKLALELRKLNNFQSLMAIVAGFNTSPVQRLKHTKELLDKDLHKKYLLIEELMSPHGSFKNYRTGLKKAHVPAIPFLGVYLSDLVFIDEGNEDENNGKINFYKRGLVYSTLQTLQLYQTSGFAFQPIQPLNNFLQNIPVMSDNELYSISLVLEPRGATKETIK